MYCADIAGEGGCGQVEMLFVSSLVALAGSGDAPAFSTRKLHLRNTKTRADICELNFLTSVLAVRLNRRRLAVVLEQKIHLYDIVSMKIQYTLDTRCNARGLCALAATDASLLAYPHADTGEVVVYDCVALRPVAHLPAHKGPLSALAFNADASLLATASDKGTVIRVFALPAGTKLATLRRGASAAAISCLAFSADSALLAVGSNHPTIHIFKLPSAQSPQPPPNAVGAGMSAYLPSMLGDMWEAGERDWASARLPNACASICAFSPGNKLLYVVTEEGLFYHFLIPLSGGECKLLHEYSLHDSLPQVKKT